ncbi:putative uncharacterized protein [Firmicutes bacterium CAG:270]|nr:putative uncharacterized protein [Firmicutes bacterium CAG:270]
MNKIEIFWGVDEEFESAIAGLNGTYFLRDILDLFNKTEIKIDGINTSPGEPLEVENLIVHTDDYGSMREWAILGFTNNILENLKVTVNNVWLSNPPKKIYEDICRNYDDDIITEHQTDYPPITLENLKKIANGFNEAVIGQSQVVNKILSSIYALKNSNRKRPVTLLFLGDSGIGKTETAKYISQCIGKELVRVQFSMQQTNNAYQYIFGAEHGEDSLARELIRRKSNVVLLDEFDKVSPAFYNAFYQMFDEGVFVDSNYSVDVSKCIIICTTNYRTDEEAERNLGTPIFSRFSKVIHFQPISVEDKLIIAKKSYDSLLLQLDEEDLELVPRNKVLPFFENAIRRGMYSNIRMLRNDMEDALNYEILKARNIIL